MSQEKDRFGDKLRDLEHAREDQYFMKRDRELIDKMRKEREAQAEEGAGASRLRCPRCSAELSVHVLHGVSVDECPSCGGLWLDKGELETIAGRESDTWLGRLFRSR